MRIANYPPHRKKDEQVNNLVEQNGKALQIIKDLIKGNN